MIDRFKTALKLISINLVAMTLLIGTFDLLSFHYLPDHYVYEYSEYRQMPLPHLGRQGGYTFGYFEANADRGFDIAKNRSGRHTILDVTYPIWSNALGCFDREHEKFDGYIYFAGDSFTFGYAPYEKKFGTLLEVATNKPILKCGVGHTGTQHQYSKLRDIVRHIGKPPEAVILFYFGNDVANDYVFPHTTVVKGWLVETRHLDHNYRPIHVPLSVLEKRVSDDYPDLVKQRTADANDPVTTAKYYSLTLNILIRAADLVRPKHPAEDAAAGAMSQNQKEAVQSRRKIGLYSLPMEKSAKRFHFTNFPEAENNRDALLKFKTFAKTHNVPLVVILIPPRERSDIADWYAELWNYLNQHGIEYVDLAREFERRGPVPQSLYWRNDRHFNIEGNAAVAEILLDTLPHIFGSKNSNNVR